MKHKLPKLSNVSTQKQRRYQTKSYTILHNKTKIVPTQIYKSEILGANGTQNMQPLGAKGTQNMQPFTPLTPFINTLS